MRLHLKSTKVDLLAMYDIPTGMKPGPGPWDQEDDKYEWINEATGYPCIIVRNQMHAFCGYVGIPKNHALAGKSYSEIEDAGIDVHGGVTYSGEGGVRISIDPSFGFDPDSIYWVGFDCLHAFDLVPSMQAMMKRHLPAFKPEDKLYKDVYRTAEYTMEQTDSLAVQLYAQSVQPEEA